MVVLLQNVHLVDCVRVVVAVVRVDSKLVVLTGVVGVWWGAGREEWRKKGGRRGARRAGREVDREREMKVE